MRLSTYAIKIIKCRALHLQGPGGDVVSEDPYQSNPNECVYTAEKLRTVLRYQCKWSYHCSQRAGERRAGRCKAIKEKGAEIVKKVLVHCRVVHLNNSLRNFWGR